MQQPLFALIKVFTLEAFKKGEALPLGNVLLTGATGYLGMHILHELLENTSCKVYCMLRAKGRRSGVSRLQSLGYYYFQSAYRELLGKRLFVVEGDVTDYADFAALKDCHIDTVINCAASEFPWNAREPVSPRKLWQILIVNVIRRSPMWLSVRRIFPISSIPPAPLDMSREYTLQVLYRLGLAWPVTSWDYLRKFMGALNGLGYFDEA